RCSGPPPARLIPGAGSLKARRLNAFGRRDGGSHMVTLRTYKADDAPALLTLFRDTIRRVTARDYAPDQIRAWASDDIDPAHWASRFAGRFVPVAEESRRPVGFAELEADGHTDRVYASADQQRQGT